MNLLITGAWNNASEYLDDIKGMGHTVIFHQFEKEKLLCPYEWVEGIICNGLFLYHSIEKFTSLRYIQLTSAGFDRIPMEYIQEKQIEIHNARDVYSIPMAEFAVGGVLQLYKKSSFFWKNKKKHGWEKHRGLLELHEKRVCIVGCGSVGTECAKRFQAFGCKVTGADLFPRKQEYYNKIVGLEHLDSVLLETDIIILTLPLTEATKNFMNDKKFALLKNGSVLVNISRGAIVDTQALISALERLGGAVLDVFEQEPLEESSLLWDMEHVILSPHNSFVSDGNNRRLGMLIMDSLKKREEKL